jgi:hypothetical protein
MILIFTACARTERDDSVAGDRPVPTPEPTPTEVVEEEPDPTPEPTEPAEIDEPDDWYELVTSEKTYPQAEIGETILELAENPDEFGELWTWFEFDPADPVPELDWENRVMLFVGTGESSGCPLVLDSITFDSDERLISVGASKDVPEDTMCTMDWTPRMFVLLLDNEYLGDGKLRAGIYDTEFQDAVDLELAEVIREE